MQQIVYIHSPHRKDPCKEGDRRYYIENQFLEPFKRIDQACQIAEPLWEAESSYEERVRFDALNVFVHLPLNLFSCSCFVQNTIHEFTLLWHKITQFLLLSNNFTKSNRFY